MILSSGCVGMQGDVIRNLYIGLRLCHISELVAAVMSDVGEKAEDPGYAYVRQYSCCRFLASVSKIFQE